MTWYSTKETSFVSTYDLLMEIVNMKNEQDKKIRLNKRKYNFSSDNYKHKSAKK